MDIPIVSTSEGLGLGRLCWFFVLRLLVLWPIAKPKSRCNGARKALLCSLCSRTELLGGRLWILTRRWTKRKSCIYSRCRLLHEVTQEPRYLELLKNGADYECLWRYGFKAKPEYPPLSTCGSCGGSILFSNPFYW